ncbi:Flp family type IVb pilin [Promicromonospora panici]|uniref:Flp family type IVb pilin n=1 Tax=Promicromonospora panici TaxID=2219658 RepID=UPI001F5C9FB0|nr:Flp family type IVb pilin [Promicromonospora panici]
MSRAAALLMTSLHVLTARFDGAKKDRGATAVEYGLLVGLIAVAIIVTLVALGPKLNALFNDVLTKLPAPAA